MKFYEILKSKQITENIQKTKYSDICVQTSTTGK